MSDPIDHGASGRGISRRGLLAAASAMGMGALMYRLGGARVAHAQVPPSSRHRFIFCYFGGGWDQLLFLDPRDPARYTESARGRLLTDTRYQQVESGGWAPRVITAGNLTFGPAVEKISDEMNGRPRLAQYADRIAIVRGMNMGTLGHVEGYRYFLTSKFPVGTAARGTSVAVELAGRMNAPTPLPVIGLGVEGYNESQPGRFTAMGASNVDDLMVVLNRGRGYLERDGVEDALRDYAAREVPCAVNAYDRRGLFTTLRQAEQASQQVLSSGVALRLQYINDPALPTRDNPNYALVESIRARNVEIRRRYGFSQGESRSDGAAAAFAALAIKEQVAHCVSIGLAGALDTHATNNLAHAGGLYPGIAALAALIDDLATSPAPADLGGNWLDHTTIVAFSEFSRTPMFNGNEGRDHHLCSSCLLAGGNIVGNQVVGASGEVGMPSGLYDFVNRRIATAEGNGVDNIRPEHITATLLASAGLDYSTTRVSPLSALIRAS